MQLVVLGLNHKTAPVEFREQLNFDKKQVKGLLRLIRRDERIQEAVIVSTCNRTEFYMTVAKEYRDLEFMLEAVQAMVTKAKVLPEYFYILYGKNCMKHLFRVSSSLDSLVVGEGQILSQIKQAYHLSSEAGMSGTLLNTIFNRAIAVGKKVRTATKIAYNSVSVSSVAVDLAMDVLGDLEDKKILLLGAGKMSELTARHLLDKGASSIIVSNRSLERAKELAKKFNGRAISFDSYYEEITTADLVITSTGAPHYIITEKMVNKVMKTRKNPNPLVFIDIAVPRDVEPSVDDIKTVKSFNIDDLENAVEVNKNQRAKEIFIAEEIIDEELYELKERLNYLTMRPVMVRLAEKMEFQRKKALKRACVKLGNLTPKETRVVERLSERLTHKFLREPMILMNKVAGTPEEEIYKDFITKMFLLEENGEELTDETNYSYWD